MKPCYICQTVIDECLSDEQFEPLRELIADDFNIRADCAISVADACLKCGGAVCVSENESATPDYHPACRSDIIDLTGPGLGWTRGHFST